MEFTALPKLRSPACPPASKAPLHQGISYGSAGHTFQRQKIRQYFRRRPPLGAPDIDGWRGREHMAWMFINHDIVFQELVRTEIILPYITNDFLQLYDRSMRAGRLWIDKHAGSS